MRQGTVSVIVGCHSPVHSLLVFLSWKKLHGRWPKLWETGCILLHDVGHWGKDYLTDYEQKKCHWQLGTRLAGFLFGKKGYELVAGHCPNESGFPESLLYKPDKYSWYLAPSWWQYWNNEVEPKIRHRLSRRESVRSFRAQVKASIESGCYKPTHQIYLERIGEKPQ